MKFPGLSPFLRMTGFLKSGEETSAGRQYPASSAPSPRTFVKNPNMQRIARPRQNPHPVESTASLVAGRRHAQAGIAAIQSSNFGCAASVSMSTDLQ